MPTEILATDWLVLHNNIREDEPGSVPLLLFLRYQTAIRGKQVSERWRNPEGEVLMISDQN